MKRNSRSGEGYGYFSWKETHRIRTFPPQNCEVIQLARITGSDPVHARSNRALRSQIRKWSQSLAAGCLSIRRDGFNSRCDRTGVMPDGKGARLQNEFKQVRILSPLPEVKGELKASRQRCSVKNPVVRCTKLTTLTLTCCSNWMRRDRSCSTP